MTTKHEVIRAHRAHPDWGSSRLGRLLGCQSAYVRATAQRNGLKLGRDKAPGGRPRKYDHDAVLDLWAAGQTEGTIFRRVGMPTSRCVGNIVKKARRDGDARAVRRRRPHSQTAAEISSPDSRKPVGERLLPRSPAGTLRVRP